MPMERSWSRMTRRPDEDGSEMRQPHVAFHENGASLPIFSAPLAARVAVAACSACRCVWCIRCALRALRGGRRCAAQKDHCLPYLAYCDSLGLHNTSLPPARSRHRRNRTSGKAPRGGAGAVGNAIMVPAAAQSAHDMRRSDQRERQSRFASVGSRAWKIKGAFKFARRGAGHRGKMKPPVRTVA